MLQVTDNSGNTDRDTVSIVVVNNLRYEEKLVISPNPARQMIRLNVASDQQGLALVRIYDLHGKTVLQTNVVKQTATATLEVPIHQLSRGVYFAEVRIGEIKQLIARFIKL